MIQSLSTTGDILAVEEDLRPGERAEVDVRERVIPGSGQKELFRTGARVPVIFTLVQPAKSTRTSGTRHLAVRTRISFRCMVKRHPEPGDRERRPRWASTTDEKWMNRVEVFRVVQPFPLADRAGPTIPAGGV